MRFLEFCKKMEEISNVSGDKEKISLLSQLFEESKNDIEHVAVFSKGDIFPTVESNKKIGMGKSRIIGSISMASGESEEKVENIVKEEGDIGKACEKLDIGDEQGQATLGQQEVTVQEVYDKLEHISQIEGSGSQKEKKQVLSSLLSSCYSLEGKYIIKLIMDELRVGIGEGSVRDAISIAFNVDIEKVKRGIMVNADVGKVAKAAQEEKLEEILDVRVGHPVKAMLAQKAEVEEVIDEFGGKTSVEYKYDGFRIQIHKDCEDVEIYSRNLENLTNSLPDIVELVQENVSSSQAILDGEAVAYENGEPQDFQKVLKRMKRKYNIDEKMEEINVEIKLFDLLYEKEENGIIDTDFKTRRKILEAKCGEDITSNYTITDNTEEIRRIRAKAIEEGQEGVMVKDPESQYTPGKRGKEWLKLKRGTETLDCVVVGGEWGEGERSNWISSYQLAVKDEDENLQEIGKVGTGFSEEEFKEITERVEELINEEDGMQVSFKPELVFEVDYEEIQNSPEYSSGYALRFPRFIKIREDKDINSADTIQRVERIKQESA